MPRIVLDSLIERLGNLSSRDQHVLVRWILYLIGRAEPAAPAPAGSARLPGR